MSLLCTLQVEEFYWNPDAITFATNYTIGTHPYDIFIDSNNTIYGADERNRLLVWFKQTTIAPTTMMVTINKTCVPPTVTLIPNAPISSSPVQFRRSQDFTIVSLIQLNCNESLAFTTQWIIKNCSSNCLHQILLDSSIITTSTEMYIPGRTLQYGLYEMTLTVTMTQMPSLSVSKTIYIQITPSGITANLIPYGTSSITRGDQQYLQLNPGSYSVDPDADTFNASIWKYTYYCRIYGLSKFPSYQSSLLSIDDMRNDPLNPSCLLNRTGWQFDNAINSSFTILSDSLQPNRTYQFMAQMQNIRNSSVQATGYVLVKVVETRPQMILIGCVIWTMCEPNLEFQLVNPTTQVALFSECSGDCTTLRSIIWNIYQGEMNSSSNFTQWVLFTQNTTYQNIWLFGTNTTNFTAINQLFLSNPQIDLWRFEVVYTFQNETSSSSLNFIINRPPSNGSCSINPLNGTTSSLFDISCSNWFDDDGIKDYIVYSWTTNRTKKAIVSYFTVPVFQIQLSSGDNQTSLLNLIVHIRDQLDCVTETNISSVHVTVDTVAMNNLLSDIQNSSGIGANPIAKLLTSGNQNLVGQVLTSVSQQFNQMNSENANKAVSNGIPAASISISSLDSSSGQQTSIPLNQTALDEYQQDLNSFATVRDYLITFTSNLLITSVNSIKLQASSLAQLTKSTNELTRKTSTIASDRCYQLGKALYSMRTKVAFEDVQMAATDLLQCATNLLSATNGPLQQRTTILDLDSIRATKFPDDYDTDLEFEWSNPNLFADDNDFSWETIQKNRNGYYQKKIANELNTKMTELISLLTSTLNLHLNIGQDFNIDTPQVLMTLETKSSQFLSTQFTKQVGSGQVQLPNNFNSNLNNQDKISIRSVIEPLASFGNSKVSSNTNLSRTISFSILDQNHNEIPIQTSLNQSIEIIIPRDPNL
ncbi:hypothetical protein I4U23_000353 [Adineta vaga]|nr:hypothetical protein I4U23_000353 [Adineta vaga]